MKTYTIKWRRKGQWFWKTEKNLIGHRYEAFTQHIYKNDKGEEIFNSFAAFGKLVFQYSDRTMKEIPDNVSLEVRLTKSWYEFTKTEMQKEAGGQSLAFTP